MMPSFFDQVHKVVRRIPPGRVATDGQIARMLGSPRSARTVGWALRAVPEGQSIPWQRVVNGRGQVSFAQGTEGALVQRVLLEGEGIVFDVQGRIDLDLYGWEGLDLAERDRLLGLSPQL